MKKLNDLINNLETYKELTTVPRDTLIKELKECKAELTEQLTLTDVSKRYDANKYTPPFRVGRKQGKAVLDGKGIEVVFFNNSEEQAKMYCDYLNNVC